jgi:hypothetical protein
MSDPQDLLYTNKFIDTNIITPEQINNDTKYYDRFINYLDENPENQVQNYLDKNLNENDLVNIQQTIDKPWPINNKKNRYPLLSNISSDISKDRYVQEQVIQFIVNSEERNKTFYPYSTEFEINFPKPLNNMKGIELSNISVPNFNDNITNMNNVFAWQYFSNIYKNYVSSFNIIPFNDLKRKISYFSLPYSTFLFDTNKTGINYNPELYLTYQLNMPNAHYDIELLLDNVKILSKNVLHGSFNYNQLYLAENNSKSRSPDQELPPIMEEPYNSLTYMQNTPNLWDFEVNFENEAFFAVNRMEEEPVYSYQTFTSVKDPSTYNWANVDVFYNFSSNPGNLDPKYLYITVPYIDQMTNYWYYDPVNAPDNPFVPSAFPLVLSKLSTKDDNLNSFMRNLNFTPFFDLNLYLLNTQPIGSNPITYTEDELENICYYKFNDIITIPNGTGGNEIKLIRFALRYNSSGEKGKKFNNSVPLTLTPTYSYYKPVQTITLIYSTFIYSLLTEKTNIVYTLENTDPILGRTLLTRFIFDINNGIYTSYEKDLSAEKKRSFLDLLGYSIANQTSAFLVSDFNNGFSFVHCNRYPKILDINNPSIYYNIVPLIAQLVSPETRFQFTINNGKYYFSKNPYIYIQIFFVNNNGNTIVEEFNYQTNQDNFNLAINQNYSNSFITNLIPIGISVDCSSANVNIRTKNKSNIVAKLLTSNVPGELNNVNNNIYKENIFYMFSKIIDSVDSIQINILDYQYKIIQSNKTINMILKIYQDVHKLKETNINTKTNNIDIIGKIR